MCVTSTFVASVALCPGELFFNYISLISEAVEKSCEVLKLWCRNFIDFHFTRVLLGARETKSFESDLSCCPVMSKPKYRDSIS